MATTRKRGKAARVRVVLYGFEVRSLTGSLRVGKDADIAMARVLVVMARKSSADTARRVKRAALQAATGGRWHDGKPPFGYRTDNGFVDAGAGAGVDAQAGATDMILAEHSLYPVVRVERLEKAADAHPPESQVHSGDVERAMPSPSLP